MERHDRKLSRLADYDYTSPNKYFVTICTHNRICLFGTIGKLSRLGQIAANELSLIDTRHQHVQVEKSVVMPNHIHAIITIGCDSIPVTEALPSLSAVLGLYKAGVTRIVRQVSPSTIVWQKSFHDHIIRNQHEYEEIWKYIDENPQKWDLDRFYQR